ncbi:hypothetical protein LINPERPRIM_LOCUS25061 [Linum perenne]
MWRQEGVGSLRRGSSMTVNRAMLVTASHLTCVDEDFELHATISDHVSNYEQCWRGIGASVEFTFRDLLDEFPSEEFL